MRLLVLGGVIGPVVFAVVTIAAATMQPTYDHESQFISELGANGSESAALMNYAGFVPAGLMIAAFGIGLGRFLPKRRLYSVSSYLVCVFGVGVAVEGLISCDPGCPQGTGTTENIIHNTLAPMIFLCLIVAIVSFGMESRKDEFFRGLSVYSILSGVLGLLSLAALASSLEVRELTGLWQRILLLVFFSWCMVIGTFVTIKNRTAALANITTESDA